ncbi:hypothetical protein GQ53DRAFT_871645 [Thozetella sp. PMI_491]|nr:hypothetical protein GQ53DRAFT_871645 [Thozetella sp. PMI_491]
MRTAPWRLLAVASLAGLSYAAGKADLLFPFNMTDVEYQQIRAVGLTAYVCKNASEWYNLTTADFAQYRAIIVPDPYCGRLSGIDFLDDTKGTWSPAVQGNVVLIGTDPSYHAKSRPGAADLMKDTISFAASGTKGTGLYFSLSCYYGAFENATVSSLSEFGTFNVRGDLSCYNAAHLVANASALTRVNDTSLSNWSCSVHEVFSGYPTIEPNAFVPLAIAENATGVGKQSFADGTMGIPYIIARGVTPLGCGNNITQPEFGEECDNGDLNGTPGNLCSATCRCLNGVLGPGVCSPAPSNSSSSSTISSTLSAFDSDSNPIPELLGGSANRNVE